MTDDPSSRPDPWAPPPEGTSTPPPASPPPPPPPAYGTPPPAAPQPPQPGGGSGYDAPPPGYGTPPPPPPGYPPPGYPPPPGQPGQPGQPGGYGYAYPGYAYAPPRTSGKAITVLVLGIASILACGLLGIVALVIAPDARREIAASNGTLTGEGQIKAGVICSWIAIGLMVLVVLALVIAVVAGASGN